MGLTSAEVSERVARGQRNAVPSAPSRTVGQIVRGNTFTVFNAILGTLTVVVLVYGNWRDALFGLVVVANTGIGIIQELRAKATLDRLAVLGAVRPTVLRDGERRVVEPGEIVLDDVLPVSSGDRIVVDGVVCASAALEVDESLLTGESDPVYKRVGDPVLSGSFAVAGTGCYQATAVGPHAFAAGLAEEARRFTLVHSQLMASINTILRVMVTIMVPVAVLLTWSQLRSHEHLGTAVSGAVAGVITMIPEGLVLLTSVAFAVGVVRLGRHQVLVQELPAVELLARVDVVCLDKTGTLTEPGMHLADVRVVDAAAPVPLVLAGLVGTEPEPNASLAAVARRYPAAGAPTATVVVPFSSVRRWSGATLDGLGSWVLGAPDVLLPVGDPARVTADQVAATGRRVLVLARASSDLADPDRLGPTRPAALLVLEQRIKPDAARTLAYFAEQGVAVKVISGDNPRTVAAVVSALGVPGAGDGVDGGALPTDPEALADVVEEAVAFGRVTPRQKQAMVAALQARGHVVAMTGDGVNDVLAVKDADLGIAMASGSDATRAVAQLVLVDNRFEHLPIVVAEGRRVINNVERVANLFLTKTVYATLLSVLCGVLGLPFPFLPRHLTVVTALTIGIPGFFLALAPNTRRAQAGFIPRVLRFAVPAGVVAAVATFGAYASARLDEDVTAAEASTLAAMVLFLVVWWAVVVLARPLSPLRLLLVGTLLAGFVLVLMVPFARDFFAFALPTVEATVVALTVGAAAIIVLELVLGVTGWDRPVSPDASSPPPRADRGRRAQVR